MNEVESNTWQSIEYEWNSEDSFTRDLALSQMVCLDTRGIDSPLPVIESATTEQECNELVNLCDPITREWEEDYYGRWVSNQDRLDINRNIDTIDWVSIGLLVFMAPTIIAYGRIMGASWNVIVRNKYRTMRGLKTPIDPDSPSIMKKSKCYDSKHCF